MSQINITLEFNELVELFTKDRNEAGLFAEKSPRCSSYS